MTFLKQYWQIVIIGVLVVVVIVLYDLYQGQKMTAESRGSIIREKEAEIEYRKTREGQVIADKEAAEARAKDIEEAYPKLAKKLESMEVKFSSLRTAIQAEFRALNSGRSTIVRDSIVQPGRPVQIVDSVKINDDYLSLKGQISGDGFDWQYSYQDSVTIALHVKKKWFLGKETLYSSIMLKNPNAKVINSTTVQVKEFRDKRWVLSIGGSYDPFSNTFRPGVNVGFKVFAF